MRKVRGAIAVLAAVSLSALGSPPVAARAAAPVVMLTGTSADITTSQFVDDTHTHDADTTDSDFFTFAHHLAPARVSGVEGTASAFANQAASVETPGQPPFPTGPLNDIAVSGTATAAATATGQLAAVPVAFAEGTADVQFTTSAPVAAFFNGTLITTNTTSVDECSHVTVDLIGPGTFDRSFSAFTGADCAHPGPHQRSFAETDTLPAGEWELKVEYEGDVDAAQPQQPKSVAASARALVNLSLFPPTARFSTTLSGSTAHFDATRSSAGTTGNHVTRWKWNFGDGRTATTTSPKTTHRYAAAPKHTPTYRVTLQVVDSGGSVSAPAHHAVLGTATTLAVTRTAAKIRASGSVHPGRPHRALAVTLSRRAHGTFHAVRTVHPKLTARSRYAASFSRPRPGTCRVLARYPGDATHLASQASRTVGC